MIDLAQFSSKDPGRPTITQPWSRGGFTYSTNGHVLIRVPERKGVAASGAAPIYFTFDGGDGLLMPVSVAGYDSVKEEAA